MANQNHSDKTSSKVKYVAPKARIFELHYAKIMEGTVTNDMSSYPDDNIETESPSSTWH